VREARPEDVPVMLALERGAETAAHWREEEYLRIFDPESMSRIALVADDGSGIDGFIVASAATEQWELENVVVAQAANRRGIGSALVRELVRIGCTREAESIVLEVRASNAAARGLYEKCGFEVVGRRQSYYRDPDEDALIYRLKLVGV
jgi:ribosomal-protein-alanine N-acetyltransferase